MRPYERIKDLIKAGLAFVEAMEAGSSGYVEDRIESLEQRVMGVEAELRHNAAPLCAKTPAPTPQVFV